MPQLSDPVHFTTLRNMNRSPAHYRAAVEQPREASTAMRFGRIVHAVILGGEPYVIWHGGRRSGKAYDEWAAEHEGELQLTEDEYQRALWCADSIGGRPYATRLLVGAHEVERTWTTLGRACAGRIDVLGDGFVTELKTTSSAHPDVFRSGALRLLYHAQLAWYLDAIGHPEWTAHIVAVETAPPFEVTVFDLTPRALDDGRRLCRLWMERLLVCEAANEWPGYVQCPVSLDVDADHEPLIIDGEEVEAA